MLTGCQHAGGRPSPPFQRPGGDRPGVEHPVPPAQLLPAPLLQGAVREGNRCVKLPSGRPRWQHPTEEQLRGHNSGQTF